MTPSAPLSGIRVLDFTHVLAGPVCSRLLADLGADVLKVETGKRRDRPWSAVPLDGLGRTHAFVMVHRGKKSIAIDLKTEEGAALARRLASVADVVVENFSAGVMTRLGLGHETLRELNPRLVFVSMSGYGNDGPRCGWTSMNVIMQAHSGLMMASESEGQPPVMIANSWMDYIGGYHGCFSVLEGLGRRHRSGEGCYIDLSQFECAVSTLGPLLLAGIVNGEPSPRTGNRSPSMAPQGCYRCAGEDAWCAISVENDAQWRALGPIMGDLPWASDPRFDSLLGRLRNHDEIDRHIENWTRELPAAAVAERLRASGISAARMRTVADVVREDAGGDSVFRFVPFGAAQLLMSVPPFRFVPPADTELAPLPRLGEHTDESLAAWLGLEATEIERLHEVEALV